MDEIRDLAKQVRDSGLFDSEWYLKEYPDVARLGLDPAEHYARWGWKLGRKPSPSLDAGSFPGRSLTDKLPARALSDLVRPRPAYARNGAGSISGAAPAGTSESVPTTSKRKLPITALVIAWDVGHNPLGRAYMLAEVLDRVVRNVVLAGFQFPRYGTSLWEPVRDGRLPVIALPTSNFPEMLAIWDRIARRFAPDVVFACKARLPSLQLAAMIRQRARCPLILDIDDHELSFFGDAPQLEPSHLAGLAPGSELSREPYERIWTQLAHGLRGSADQIIVSNPALQREFGGTIVPHVRDEIAFDPSRHDRKASRAKYGVPTSAKVTLFLGTPRAHKGIQALAQAVGKLNPDHRLVIVGTATDKRDIARLHELAPGRVILIPNQPFAAIPEIVSMADVVCLPQDPSSPVSRYQLPAKAIDAIAMNVPLLVVPTEPMDELISAGLATPVDPSRLSEEIARATEAPRADHVGRLRRDGYLSRYSYAAAAKTLHQVIERARARPVEGEDLPLEELLRHQRRLIGAPAHTVDTAAKKGKCVVLFWKQNDTTLYGRRHDMTVAYLASRNDIRKVVVFDAPISEHELLARRNKAGELTQDRQIYVRTYQKLAGGLDIDKIAYHVFVHPPGRYRAAAPDDAPDSLTAAFATYVGDVLQAEGVTPADAIFWIYPRNYHASALLDRFKPARIVVDVVDDHRSWPDVSRQERERLTEHYRDMLGRASFAFANCEPVLQAMRPYNPGIRLVPNGCDDHIQIVPPVGDATFDELCAFPGKVIGFVGNLEKKLDIELIEKVADRFSDGLILLLGSTHANPDVTRLRCHPNVRMPGVIPYDQVGAWVSRFHVGIIPHLCTELTRSMNPLKLYVYLSLGVPVVCTEIFNVDRSSKAVRIEQTHEDFLSAIAATLLSGKVERATLDAYVQANTWEKRFRSHVDDILTAGHPTHIGSAEAKST